LAMPSTLATDRRGAGSRRVLSRETRPPGSGEITLSQELRTVGLLWPHVLVGYQWSHTGLRPGRKTSHNRYIRSFVSQPPWNQGDPRCSFPPWPPGPRQGWAAGSDRFWLLELRVSRTFLDQLRPQLSGHGYPARRAAGRRTPTIYRSSAQPTIFAGSWFGQALLTSPDPPHPLRPPVSQSPTGGAPPGDPRRTKQIRNNSSRDQRAVKTNFAACHSPATIECARQALKTTEMAKQSMGGPRRWKSSWNTVLFEITNRRPSV